MASAQQAGCLQDEQPFAKAWPHQPLALAEYHERTAHRPLIQDGQAMVAGKPRRAVRPGPEWPDHHRAEGRRGGEQDAEKEHGEADLGHGEGSKARKHRPRHAINV